MLILFDFIWVEGSI